jgi:transposase
MELSIGIDWSDRQHAICIREFDTRRILAEFEIEHNAAGIAQLEGKVETLGSTPGNCVVAVETNQGMLVNYLMEAGYHIHPIPPAAVTAYRNRRRRTGAKSDGDDAQLLAGILCQDREHYPPLASDSPLAWEIRATYRGREQLVGHRTQVLNRLQQNLKTYYPVAIGLFSSLYTRIAQAFLTHFPTQRAVQAATEAELREFFTQQGYSRPDNVQEIITKLHAPTIPVPAWQANAGSRLTAALLAELAVLCEHIREVERRLAELVAQHPDAFIFQSLPRVGPIMTAGFIGELGDCRAKFANASAMQALAGTAPVTIPLRHLLQQFARQSTLRGGSAWARGYLANQLERGHSNSRAYRALANRWLVIIFRIWQDRTLYDENYHLRNIALRGAQSPPIMLDQVA